MTASPQFRALLRAYVGEAESWAKEAIYRQMIEEFRYATKAAGGKMALPAGRVAFDDCGAVQKQYV